MKKTLATVAVVALLANATASAFVFVQPLSKDPLTRGIQLFRDFVARQISSETRLWIEENCKGDASCRKAAFNITNAYQAGILYSGNEVDEERYQAIRNTYNNTYASLLECAQQVKTEIKNARTLEQARTTLTVMCQKPIINFIHASCHYGGTAETVCRSAEEKILSHQGTLAEAVMAIRSSGK
nr:MAG TPA: hydrolase [Caudoviricetes sp.]